MNSFLSFLVFSSLIGSSLAVKCFVCSSKVLDKDASDDFKNSVAYSQRECQDPNSECDDSSKVVKDITVADFYKGEKCESFDQSLNATDSPNIFDCAIGCVKILTSVEDRDEDKSRVTRQCAYHDKDATEKYLDTSGFKRTGSGSDKVLNWFYYCTGDHCNSASSVSSTVAIMIVSFYGVFAAYF